MLYRAMREKNAINVYRLCFLIVCLGGVCMNPVKRAFLYLFRHGARSVILFFTMFVMVFCSLVGFSVISAASDVMLQLRRELSGFIALDKNRDEDGPALTQEDVDAVAALENVRTVGTQSYTRMVFPQLTLLEPSEGAAEMAHYTRVWGVTQSALSPYFLHGTFEIARGRALEEADKNCVLVSENVAFASGLNVGDTLQAHWRISETDYDPEGFEATIVGVYRVNQQDALVSSDGTRWNIPANIVFMDAQTLYEIRLKYNDAGENRTYTSASVVMVDASLAQQTAQQIDEITGQRYSVRIDDAAYQAMVAPVLQMRSLVQVLLIVMLSVFIVMLTLLLALWVRNRIYEIGVFLSIGKSKGEIIAQMFCECLAVALIALVIAVPAAQLCAEKIGDSFYERAYVQSQAQSQDEENSLVPQAREDVVHTRISLRGVLLTAVVDLAVTLFGTFVSAIMVLRLRPKQIFSMMS